MKLTSHLLWPFVGLALAGAPRAQAADAPAPAKAPAKAAVDPKAEPEGLLRLAASTSQRGDFATAQIAFWQVLNRADATDGEIKTALLGLAHVHRRQGSLTKAAAIYEKFVKEFPDDERVPDALLELGRTLRDMGVYRLAISRFYSVINSTLKFPSQGFEHYRLVAKTAQFEIAQTHFEAGDYADAAKYFSRVRLLDLAAEDRARAHFMAAFAEQLAGDWDTSVVTLRSYLEQWPDDRNEPEARYLLATGLRHLQRPQEALAATLTLLRSEHARVATDPQRWSYWQRRTGNQIANEFFQNGDTFNALAIYQGLSGLSDDPAWRLPVSYQIALCFERLGQLDQARLTYQGIVDAGAPHHVPAPSAEITEMARMAAWRLAHLDWRDQTERRISAFFPAADQPPPSLSPPNRS